MIAPNDAQQLLQQAVYDRLISIPALMSVVQGVYDFAPQVKDSASNAPYPYVVLGDISIVENDTDTEVGYQAAVTLHVWSRERGRKETQQIQGLIYQGLHQQEEFLTIEGFGVSTVQQELSDSFTDPDGITRHGVQRFTVIFEYLN